MDVTAWRGYGALLQTAVKPVVVRFYLAPCLRTPMNKDLPWSWSSKQVLGVPYLGVVRKQSLAVESDQAASAGRNLVDDLDILGIAVVNSFRKVPCHVSQLIRVRCPFCQDDVSDGRCVDASDSFDLT